MHTPISINKTNEMKLWEKQQQQQKQQNITVIDVKNLKLLDYVRISRLAAAAPFIKNFDQKWSEEIFRIVGVDISTLPTMYIIEDLQHNVIVGKFYKPELQVIHGGPPLIYRIEKILQTKGRGVYKQYYVKWYGYGKEHNSWIGASKLQKGFKQ